MSALIRWEVRLHRAPSAVCRGISKSRAMRPGAVRPDTDAVCPGAGRSCNNAFLYSLEAVVLLEDATVPVGSLEEASLLLADDKEGCAAHCFIASSNRTLALNCTRRQRA